MKKIVKMEKKSPHILNASSNLLGFSLIIITSLKIARISQSSIWMNLQGLPVSFSRAAASFRFWLSEQAMESGNTHLRLLRIIYF